MKSNIIKACALSTMLLGSSAVSAAQEGTYVNAQVSIPDVTGFSGGLAVIATYGMPMTDLMPSLDVGDNIKFEGEFSTTLTSPDASFLGATLEASYMTFAGYAVYTNDISDVLTFRGRAGLRYADMEIDTAFGSASDTDIGLSYGVGVAYTFSDEMNLIAEYTIIESDISHLSAGVQFAF